MEKAGPDSSRRLASPAYLPLDLDREVFENVLLGCQLLEHNGRHHLQRVHDGKGDLPQLLDPDVRQAGVEQPLQAGLAAVGDVDLQGLPGG